ncbi:hypothetical protein ABZ621_30925 [Streptomyces sp. NPDC007863]|uniref:hypothetical protein n=1 Tax=Streptomyces sp. NPDC007863 TaxID=3154894 RepID=UPI0033DB1CD0
MTSRSQRQGPVLGCAIPIALAIAAAGIWLLNVSWGLAASEGRALCGSREMDDGQVCVRGIGDDAVQSSADEQKKGDELARRIFGWIGIAAGGAIGVGGVALLVVVIKDRDRNG